MKGFPIALVGIIFVVLIACSVQSISADDLEPNQEIFKGEKHVTFSSTEDSKYLIHLQIIVRNTQDQLVSVSETDGATYLTHEITDYVFDKMLGKKEIIIIDNMKYQKVHYMQTKNAQHLALEGVRYDEMQSAWSIEYCTKTSEQKEVCGQIFSTVISHIALGEDDTFTIHWTILRVIG